MWDRSSCDKTKSFIIIISSALKKPMTKSQPKVETQEKWGKAKERRKEVKKEESEISRAEEKKLESNKIQVKDEIMASEVAVGGWTKQRQRFSLALISYLCFFFFYENISVNRVVALRLLGELLSFLQFFFSFFFEIKPQIFLKIWLLIFVEFKNVTYIYYERDILNLQGKIVVSDLQMFIYQRWLVGYLFTAKHVRVGYKYSCGVLLYSQHVYGRKQEQDYG